MRYGIQTCGAAVPTTQRSVSGQPEALRHARRQTPSLHTPTSHRVGPPQGVGASGRGATPGAKHSPALRSFSAQRVDEGHKLPELHVMTQALVVQALAMEGHVSRRVHIGVQ